MTSTQFARAAGADQTWLFNTERILGRRFPRTVAGSRELALIRMLQADLGIDLADAAGIARARARSRKRGATQLREVGGAIGLLIDPVRFDSIWLLDLAAALDEGPRMRGRPPAASGNPIERARRYGIDIDLLKWQLSHTVGERLDTLDASALPRIKSR
ncbi:MAG TPA: hypothetical protein PLL69_05470 [Gemmatimonadales bacterium]|nr:hypothetical protein [Gemmatimonadales bacterium]